MVYLCRIVSALQVVRLSLEVMAKISTKEEYFQQLMTSLVTLFSSDATLLEKRSRYVCCCACWMNETVFFAC